MGPNERRRQKSSRWAGEDACPLLFPPALRLISSFHLSFLRLSFLHSTTSVFLLLSSLLFSHLMPIASLNLSLLDPLFCPISFHPFCLLSPYAHLLFIRLCLLLPFLSPSVYSCLLSRLSSFTSPATCPTPSLSSLSLFTYHTSMSLYFPSLYLCLR